MLLIVVLDALRVRNAIKYGLVLVAVGLAVALSPEQARGAVIGILALAPMVVLLVTAGVVHLIVQGKWVSSRVSVGSLANGIDIAMAKLGRDAREIGLVMLRLCEMTEPGTQIGRVARYNCVSHAMAFGTTEDAHVLLVRFESEGDEGMPTILAPLRRGIEDGLRAQRGEEP